MTMTLIEGVGDEVTLFFVLLLLAVVACLAWWTTRVADRPLRIQTIIVGQRVIHVDDRDEPAAAAATEAERGQPEPPAAPDEPPGAEPNCEEDESVVSQGEREERSSGDGAAEDRPSEDTAAEETTLVEDEREDGEASTAGRDSASSPADPASGSTGPAIDPTNLVSDSLDPVVPLIYPVIDGAADEAASPPSDPDPAPDPVSDSQQVRRRRLAFFDRQTVETASHSSATPADTDNRQRTLADSAASTMTERTADNTERIAPGTAERAAAETAERMAAEAVAEGTAEAAAESTQMITVKLKFLNDTQRLVEGRRAEPLADFKRRHFPTETAANRIVRLIFNGRVLPDQDTLSQCGLYHNCVVHCHVSASPRPAAGGAAAAAGGGGAAPPELDIGVLLYPVLTSVVTLVWGLRLRYPELFSGTAVVLLAVLTLLLVCFAAATFLPLERLPGAVGGRQQQRGR